MIQQPAANQSAEHDLRARLLAGDAEIIDAIILAGSVGIRAKDLHAIDRFPIIRIEASGNPAAQSPRRTANLSACSAISNRLYGISIHPTVSPGDIDRF